MDPNTDPGQERGPLARLRATVLFADITGYTALSERAGPELAYALVTGALRLLDGIARRHGGVVDKYLGDALMAVFGLAGGGDGATGAVTAALEMRRGLARYQEEVASPVPLGLQVGINTGPIVASDVRGPVVREFAVMGDAVNVAARLKDRAPIGTPYIGEETARAVGGRFVLRALPALALKGKLAEVRAHEVLPASEERLRGGPAPDALRIASVVGRTGERARLEARLAALREGRGGVVWLTGASGLGKSRLLAELAASAGADARCFEARAPRAAELAAALADDGSGAPRLLLLDDLEEAEPAAHSLLAEALPRAARDPLLFVLATACEPERDLAELAAAARDVAGEHVALAPLDTKASAELVDAVVAPGTAAATRARIVARAGGSPFALLTGALLASALETEAARDDGVARTSETERRRATVLFADITGFTAMSERMDPMEAHAIVSGCLRVLDETARKHGGTVDKYLGDCVMALFGVPVAIEDAPRAAVNAAIEMCRRVQEYNREKGIEPPIDVHIGIETGLGISGDVSGPVLREYALMGDSVNAASRLKDLAPRGQVYVGAETQRATRRHFEYRPRPPASRGEGRPPLVFHELLSRREALHRDRVGTGSTLFLDLVGRDEELRALRLRVAEAAEAGRGSISALIADPGLGKSRLLAELAECPEAGGTRWLEARSLTIGTQLGFHPFVDLLRAWSGVADEPDERAAAALLERRLADLLGADAEEHHPLLATLLGLPLSAEHARRVADVAGETRDRLIARSVRETLRAAARKTPLVLLFEDLHWADASSVELLESLLRLADEAPVCFLLAARPGFASTSGRIVEAARALQGERALVLELAPLGSTATRRLLAGIFAHGGLPVAARERIERQAAGNPFYVEEVVRSLLEQGAIEDGPDGLRATPAIHDAAIPATVQEVILSRVDRLDPERKQLLQLASVVGRSFQPPVLAALAPGADVPAALEHLVESQLLAERDEAGVRRFAFRHPMIQEITYDSMLEGKREELHRRVGEVLLRELPEGTPGRDATLAWHFGKGRDLARAEAHLFAAGDEAARTAASNEALHFFQEASRLYLALHGEQADPVKRALLERNVGLAHFNRGQLVEAARHLNHALELMGERVPNGRAELWGRFAWTLLRVLPPLYLPLSRRRPAADGREQERIQLMYRRAKAQTTGDPARFLFDTMENLRHLARVDPATVDGAGGMYASVIGIFSWGGISFGVSERFLRLAERILDERDPRERLQFAMMRFVHHFLAGGWGKEHEIEPALLDEGLRYGELWNVATHLGVEATKLLAQGRFDEARANIDRVARIEDAYAYDLASSNRHGCTAFLLLEQRRLERAAEAADVYYTEHDEPLLNVLALGTRAKAEVLLGRHELARATLATADEIVAREGLIPPFQRGALERSRLLLELDRAEAARAAGDPGAASAALQAAARAARSAVSAAQRVAWHRTEVYRAAGTLEWLRGRRRRAEDWWRRALESGERLGARPERARTALELGLRLRADGGAGARLCGDDAAAWLAHARSELEALGLEHDLARL